MKTSLFTSMATSIGRLNRSNLCSIANIAGTNVSNKCISSLKAPRMPDIPLLLHSSSLSTSINPKSPADSLSTSSSTPNNKSQSPHRKPRYFEPYRLSPLQRAFLVPYFAAGSIADPERGDLVAGLGDATAEEALEVLRRKLLQSKEGRQLLLDKPLISTSTVDLAYLSSLPDETFGKQYAIFLASHQFSPDERSRVRFMADAELAYIMTRYRQVHDFWHVLFDVPISVLGEIALKWVEFYVTGLPVCYMSGVFGPLKLSVEEKRILDQVGIPWARQASEAFKDNQLLLTFKYESHFSSNIQDIRDKLQVIKAPKFT